MPYKFNPFTGNLDTVNSDPEIPYYQYIYNSSGVQSGNRYNDWADLLTAIDGREAIVQFEQNEVLPTGNWNIDYHTWRGNGQNPDAGGLVIEFPEGCYIDSALNWQVQNGFNLYSTATTHPIYTQTTPHIFVFDRTAVYTDNIEFVKVTCNGLVAVTCANGFGLYNGAVGNYEVFNIDSSAYGTVFVVTETGIAPVIQNNTVRSAVPIVYGWLKQTSEAQAGFATQANIDAGSVDFTGAGGSLFANASVIGFISGQPTGITSTNVADALAEVQANANDRVLRAGDTMTGTLVLDDGTTTTEPLQFQDGDLLTTPATGAMEFDNNTLFFTPAVDRRSINLADGIVTSDTTVSNTTTETTIFTEPISANELHVGQVIKTRILGRYSTANGADTFTARLKVGGTTVDTLVSTAANVTDAGLDIEFVFTVRTVGATGTIWGHASAIFNDESKTDANTATTTIDTTAADDITLTIQWSNALSGNSVTVSQGYSKFIG